LHRLGVRLGAAWGSTPGGPYYATALDRTLTDLTALLGGCERIKNTPLPRQYEYLPRLLVNGYCFLGPFATVQELGSFTPVATFVLSVILLGLDDIGARIGYPFEGSASDTPVTALATTIEINLRQSIGETRLPDPVQPVDGVLS
jgi:putative membrane protein